MRSRGQDSNEAKIARGGSHATKLRSSASTSSGNTTILCVCDMRMWERADAKAQRCNRLRCTSARKGAARGVAPLWPSFGGYGLALPEDKSPESSLAYVMWCGGAEECEAALARRAAAIEQPRTQKATRIGVRKSWSLAARRLSGQHPIDVDKEGNNKRRQ